MLRNNFSLNRMLSNSVLIVVVVLVVVAWLILFSVIL